MPLLKYACWALRNLSCDNDDNRIRITQADGVELTVHTMQENPTAEELLVLACAALLNLSFDNDIKRRIGQTGGIEQILHTMQENPTA